jgi:hypothetical protein
VSGERRSQSERSQAIVQSISAWLATLPPGTFESRTLEIPFDDEYQFEILVAFEPAKREACPIELGVTAPEAGSAVALFLDTWARVARRLGGELSPDKATRIALFLEPTPMTVEKALAACRAVVGGAVHLDAGLLGEKLVCTSGWLETSTGRFRMHGVEDYLLPFVRTMSLVGFGSVRKVPYEPWA